MDITETTIRADTKGSHMQQKMDSNFAIGIDLGTTFSVVSVFKNGKVHVIADKTGLHTTPSIVAFKGNEVLVGDLAKNQAQRNIQNTIFDAKRLIGSKFTSPHIQTSDWPFSIAQMDERPFIKCNWDGEERYFSPTEISAIIISQLKRRAETFLQAPVHDAVITVPAYFNNSQRKSTVLAGKLAGLNVRQIINEPTAAVLAYEFDDAILVQRNVLVFDLGGGTFDVSLVDVDFEPDEQIKYITVKASSGNSHLGGQDFTANLARLLRAKFDDQNPDLKIDLNATAISRLREAAELCKRALAGQISYCVDLYGLHDGIDFSTEITRSEFEESCEALFEQTIEITKKLLTDANVTLESVNEVLTVGGSSRIPKIQEKLSKLFKKICPNFGLNLDEDVSRGAAIQAAILIEAPEVPKIMLRDVTPLPLGIQVSGRTTDNFAIILNKFTLTPCEHIEDFTRPSYNTTCHIAVYEGLSKACGENFLIGEFVLNDLEPLHQPPITIKLTVDRNGILRVIVTDVLSKKATTAEMHLGEEEFTLEETETKADTLRQMLGEGEYASCVDAFKVEAHETPKKARKQ